MCGICGIVDLGAGQVSEEDLVEMRDQISHRGPDDAGVYLREGVGLAARRLSIIDLSARGHMPMPSEDEKQWITYNGEIYNFLELREELAAKGHHFRSECDTEVVLAAYREWGEDCAEHLAGMFAFAIWDASQRRLFAARDRLGVKPFFFVHQGERLVFCSEIHPLYRFSPPTADRVDPLALDYYLSAGNVPPDRCFVKGLSKLPPAHTMTFDARGLRMKRYWRVRFRPTRRAPLEDTLDALDEHLGKAVVRRLRSDVPLGCFLSGGIDSGLVTALAARGSDTPINTFSVGFSRGHPDDDERPLARLVAERYGTRHHEMVVDTDHRALLPLASWHVGEPFADIGILPMLQISREARKHITVSLSGDGGDESFAGYPNVRSAHIAQRFRRAVPGPVRRLLRFGAGIPAVKSRLHAAEVAERWLGQFVERTPAEQLDPSTTWHREWRHRMYSPESLEALGDADAISVTEAVLRDAGDLLDAEMHLYADLHLRLGAGYLTKVDIASNMASLEVRSPFLDHELVEFAATLPFEQKFLEGRQKGLLRKLAERHLPHELIHQPKRGFAPAVGSWLRGEWSDLVRELVGNSHAAEAGLFRSDVLKNTAEAHIAGREDHPHRLYNYMCLEIWWRLFVDGSLSKGDAL